MVLRYSLLIHPLLSSTFSLDKSAMENLEVYGRASERGESQVPCTQEDINQSMAERPLALILLR